MGVRRLDRGFAAGCLIALFVSALVHAQEQEQNEQDADEAMDEIVVVSKKSLDQLRVELWAAEDRAYELFNELNGDAEYDIHCYREAPTGSKILRRVCRTRYEREATAEGARQFLSASKSNAPSGQTNPWGELGRKQERLAEKWRQLAIERPEFLEAVLEIHELQQVLESERQRRCEGRVFACK